MEMQPLLVRNRDLLAIRIKLGALGPAPWVRRLDLVTSGKKTKSQEILYVRPGDRPPS